MTRRGKTRIHALFIMMFLFTAILCGCGKQDDDSAVPTIFPGHFSVSDDTASHQIAVVPPSTDSLYSPRLQQSVISFNDGSEYTVVYGGASRGEEQVSYVERLIEQKVDAICIIPYDETALLPVLKQAKEAGITVVVYGSISMDRDAYTYNLQPFAPRSCGEYLAGRLIELTNGEGAYLQLVDTNRQGTHKALCDGADAYLSKNSTMTKTYRGETKHSYDEAYRMTKDALTKHQDITAILGCCPADIQGAAQAVTDAQRVGEIAITGVSFPSLCKDHLQSTAISLLSTFDPADLGYAMVELASLHLAAERSHDTPEILSLKTEGYTALTKDKENANVLYGDARIDVTAETVSRYDF